ncbi:MAG: UDP-N-acetylmuramate--L-alanine ligase [Clostridia bacterium]|nr:UDP-N-acetylmuramate--L-alanine ligase [Clostridia bacterium]
MQGLALLFSRRGFLVGGSDRAPSAGIERLRAAGIPVTIGHREENIRGYELLIYTLAVDRETPELVAARRAAIPCLSRADLLGYLMSDFPVRIGVAGMHGKSTTTAMLHAVMREAALSPTVVSGAAISPDGSVAQEGRGRIFLCEACEYKDSFLCLYPTIAVVLNCEWEHPDYFKSLDQVKASFHTYMRRAQLVILPADGKQRDLPPTSGMRVLRFGCSPAADARAVEVTYQQGCAAFNYYFCGVYRGRVRLAAPGEHNLQNALAALAVAEACHLPFEASARALAAFSGTDRRLSPRGVWRGVTVYEDYAHHPTEIRASLATLRRMMEEKNQGARLFCVFQPHTYSRTAALFDDFAKSFSSADVVLLLDIYAAREKNESGVSSQKLADAIPHACYMSDFAASADYLSSQCRPHDLLVVMGAGDVFRLFEHIRTEEPCISGKDVIQ